MKRVELVREAQNRLAASGIEEAALDALLLYLYYKKKDRTWYLLEKMTEEEDQEGYMALIGKREKRIPLQYITGEQDFAGLTFKVRPGVLIPRSDTEVLVEHALGKIRKGDRILDLCTGSSCILSSLLYHSRETTGDGVDISDIAVSVAKENADRIFVGEERKRIHILQGDLYEPAEGFYDMIVSNPPYIRTKDIEDLMPEVADHEPHLALDGDADGLLFYRKITEGAGDHLKNGGYLIYEIGCDQADDVTKIMEANGFCDVETVKDLSGLDRVVMGRK